MDNKGISVYSYAIPSLIPQEILAIAAIFIYSSGLEFIAVLCFVLLFPSLFTPGQHVIQSSLIQQGPSHLRTTVFSLVQIFGLIGYASYLAALTIKQVGVNSPENIFFHLAVLSILEFFSLYF